MIETATAAIIINFLFLLMRITAALKQFKLIDVMLHIAINRFLENIIEKSYKIRISQRRE